WASDGGSRATAEHRLRPAVRPGVHPGRPRARQRGRHRPAAVGPERVHRPARLGGPVQRAAVPFRGQPLRALRGRRRGPLPRPLGRYGGGGEGRCLVLWDLAARTPGKWLAAGGGEHVADVAFTPDGREVRTVLLDGGGVARRRVGSWRKKPGFGASPGRLGDR